MNQRKNKSTGPKTPEGKIASSKNAFKHGLASGQILVAGEDAEAFESLLQGFEEDFQPDTMTEIVLVHDLAKFHWLKNRAIRLQQQAFVDPTAIDFKMLDVMTRYQNSNQRSFMNTLKTLEAFQKERMKRHKEFVSEEDPEMLFSGMPGYQSVMLNSADSDKKEEDGEKILRFPARPPGKLA